MKEKSLLHKGIAKVLDERQLRRLQQIYVQHMVMQPDRMKLNNPFELAIEFDLSKLPDILDAMRDDDVVISEEVRVLQWKRYTASWAKALGNDEQDRLFGRPFVVDVPPEPRREGKNPRRRD